MAKCPGAVLTLSCGSRRIERAISSSWDRVELAKPDFRSKLFEQATAMRSDTSWMREGKYGLQFHWTSLSAPRRGERKPYAQACRDFPVKEFAALVKSTGAGHVIMTTSHAQHFFPAPIKAIDRVKSGRAAERDLVRDWIEALGAYDIRLMLYYHIGHDDWKQPGGWWRATGFDQKNPKVFLDNWTTITTEVGQRNGEGLAGWFFDDGSAYYPMNPDFRALTTAAKTGNPKRLVCYNPWIMPRVTDFQDYLCGEGYDFLKIRDGLPADGSGIFTSGPHKGLQAHTNFILEQDWPHSKLNTDIAPPSIPKEQFIGDMKAAIAQGIVPSVNLEIYQDYTIGESSQSLMEALKHEVKG